MFYYFETHPVPTLNAQIVYKPYIDNSEEGLLNGSHSLLEEPKRRIVRSRALPKYDFASHMTRRKVSTMY